MYWFSSGILGIKQIFNMHFRLFSIGKKRDEVITLIKEGNRLEAAHIITKGKGANHEACLMEGVSSKAVV